VSIQDWTVTMETNVKFDIQRTIHKKMFSQRLYDFSFLCKCCKNVLNYKIGSPQQISLLHQMKITESPFPISLLHQMKVAESPFPIIIILYVISIVKPRMIPRPSSDVVTKSEKVIPWPTSVVVTKSEKVILPEIIWLFFLVCVNVVKMY
jgi:hypothetical protein